MRANEARAVFAYIPATFICFVLGLAFGFYFVTPAILQVLLSLGEDLFAQNLGYGVGIGVPMALILALGDTVTPDARVHLFLGCSLILLVTGLVLALRKPKNRVAAQRDSEE